MSGIAGPDTVRHLPGFHGDPWDQPEAIAPFRASTVPTPMRLCAIWRSGSSEIPGAPDAGTDLRAPRDGVPHRVLRSDICRCNRRCTRGCPTCWACEPRAVSAGRSWRIAWPPGCPEHGFGPQTRRACFWSKICLQTPPWVKSTRRSLLSTPRCAYRSTAPLDMLSRTIPNLNGFASICVICSSFRVLTLFQPPARECNLARSGWNRFDRTQSKTRRGHHGRLSKQSHSYW